MLLMWLLVGTSFEVTFFQWEKQRNPSKSCWRLYCWEKPALATLYMNTVVSQCSDCRISLINIEISVPTTGINSGDANAPQKCRGRGTFIPLIRCVFCWNANVVEIYRNPTALHFRRSTLQNKANNPIKTSPQKVVLSYYNFKSRYFNDRIFTGHSNGRSFFNVTSCGPPTCRIAIRTSMKRYPVWRVISIFGTLAVQWYLTVAQLLHGG